MQRLSVMKKEGYLLFKTGVGEKAMKNACYNCEDSQFNVTVTYIIGDKIGNEFEWAVVYLPIFLTNLFKKR